LSDSERSQSVDLDNFSMGGNERRRSTSGSGFFSGRVGWQMARLSDSILPHILAEERTPMVVVPYDKWLSVGKFPRSSDNLTRRARKTRASLSDDNLLQHPDDDWIVFVSHRWWNPTNAEPDDKEGTKYKIVSDALKELIVKFDVDPKRLVIWCDFACISQDDPALQELGIASLIAYAAWSDLVLTPVQSVPDAMKSFDAASHPADLVNYGERAWCRLETYIFMCVGEILMRPLHYYGFGQIPGAPRPWYSCLGPPKPTWQLKRLAARWEQDRADGTMKEGTTFSARLESVAASDGAQFKADQLPSAGALTVESDRIAIYEIEEKIRQTYVHFALLAQVTRLRLEFNQQQKVLIQRAQTPNLLRQMSSLGSQAFVGLNKRVANYIVSPSQSGSFRKIGEDDSTNSTTSPNGADVDLSMAHSGVGLASGRPSQHKPAGADSGGGNPGANAGAAAVMTGDSGSPLGHGDHLNRRSSQKLQHYSSNIDASFGVPHRHGTKAVNVGTKIMMSGGIGEDDDGAGPAGGASGGKSDGVNLGVGAGGKPPSKKMRPPQTNSSFPGSGSSLPQDSVAVGSSSVVSSGSVVSSSAGSWLKRMASFSTSVTSFSTGVVDAHEEPEAVFTLMGKQVRSEDVALLAQQLMGSSVGSRITVLDLSQNLLDAGGMEMLMDGIVCLNDNLIELDISENPLLQSAGVKELAPFVLHSKLKVLHLSGCNIDSRGMHYLVGNIPRQLELLNMRDNMMTENLNAPVVIVNLLKAAKLRRQNLVIQSSGNGFSDASRENIILAQMDISNIL